MRLTPTLAAVRFGTGLSPRIAPPRDPEAVLERLLGPDRAAAQVPLDGWKATAARSMAWWPLRKKRNEGDAQRQAYRAHFGEMRDVFHATLARVLARAAI